MTWSCDDLILKKYGVFRNLCNNGIYGCCNRSTFLSQAVVTFSELHLETSKAMGYSRTVLHSPSCPRVSTKQVKKYTT